MSVECAYEYKSETRVRSQTPPLYVVVLAHLEFNTSPYIPAVDHIESLLAGLV
jgi:hypothetical protein